MKLIEYNDLSSHTWLVIILSYISFYLGVITFFLANDSFSTVKVEVKKNSIIPILFSNEGRLAYYLTIVFGIIGLIGAIQAWFVLIKLFGSVPGALLRLGALYQMRVSGELEGVWPYTSIFSYSAIFFAAVYSSTKSKITIISALPLLALIIKEIAMAGRAGILFGFVEYGFTLLFTIYFLKDTKTNYYFNNKKIIFSIVLTLVLFVSSITLVKNLRAAPESFSGETRALRELNENKFISPAMYLYVSGHIGVLNKFLEKDIEEYRIGENSFQFIYNIFSKIGITEKPQTLQKPYRIPVWINTGTFIRELIADFGFPITLIILFVLGVVIALHWNSFFEYGNFSSLVILVYLMILIFFSFLMVITRLANWYLGLGFILLTIWFVEQFYLRQVANREIK